MSWCKYYKADGRLPSMFSRLSPHADAMPASERENANHFRKGYQWNILKKVVTHQYQTYAEVFEATLEVERLESRRELFRVGEKRLHFTDSSTSRKFLRPTEAYANWWGKTLHPPWKVWSYC